MSSSVMPRPAIKLGDHWKSVSCWPIDCSTKYGRQKFITPRHVADLQLHRHVRDDLVERDDPRNELRIGVERLDFQRERQQIVPGFAIAVKHARHEALHERALDIGEVAKLVREPARTAEQGGR